MKKKRVALYVRVSTDEQIADAQERGVDEGEHHGHRNNVGNEGDEISFASKHYSNDL